MPTVKDDTIRIERSSRFATTANQITDHMQSLPLNHDQNDTLVALLVQQITEAEGTAFKQGFEMGVKLGRDIAEGKLDTAPATGPLQ